MAALKSDAADRESPRRLLIMRESPKYVGGSSKVMDPYEQQGLAQCVFGFIEPIRFEGGGSQTRQRAGGAIEVALLFEFVDSSLIDAIGFTKTAFSGQRTGELELQLRANGTIRAPYRPSQCFCCYVNGRFGIAHLQIQAGQVVHGYSERNERSGSPRDTPGLGEIKLRVAIIKASHRGGACIVPVHGGRP